MKSVRFLSGKADAFSYFAPVRILACMPSDSTVPAPPTSVSVLLPLALLLFIASETAVMSAVIAGSVAAMASAVIGLSIAGLLLAKRDGSPLRPKQLILFALGALALYLLFRGLRSRIDEVILPAYFPAAWVKATCEAGIGLLVGSGVPLLLYALVSAGYRMLDSPPNQDER
jgi:hypothetical protein